MSFVYHHRPVFVGTLRIHNSSGVFAFHEYVLEAKDTWQESDGDISFSMVKNNSTKTLQDYGDELGFNVISGDPLSYNNGGHNRGGTLAAYQIVCDSGDIVDDLSSLENIQIRPGLQATIPSGYNPVVTTTYHNQKIYEIDSKIQVRFNGTVNHDPDREVLIIKSDRNDYNRYPDMSYGSWFATTLGIGGTYNYGVETTEGDRVSYSSGTGLYIIGNARLGNWNPRDAAVTGSGTWRCRGGVISSNKMINFSSTLDVKATTFLGTPSGVNLEWRNPFGNANSSFDGFFSGYNVLNPKEFEAKLGFKNATVGEVISSSVYSGTLRDFDMSQNTADYDIGHDGMTNRGHAEWFVVNSATGTDVKTMWRDTRGFTGQRGVAIIQKEVSFNFADASGNVLEAVELYLEDNPSAYAKDAFFAADKHQAGKTYADRPDARGEVDANGNLVYKYLDAISYSKTSDSNGEISTFLVTTGTQIHEYNVNDQDAVAVYGMHFSSDRWRVSESDNTTPSYYHWDSDEFGGFYKVDRRGNDNTNADLFTFKFCSYGHSLSSSTQALRGTGELSVDWVLFDDLTITESDRTVVDAYTEIETAVKFYDRAKSYLTANYAGEGATIVSRAGIDIDAGSYNIEVDASASSAFAFDGSKITIKASAYSGNLTTTGLVTLVNGAVVLGTITDANGSRATLQYSVSGLIQHSRVQLYNVTADTEIFNGSVNATTYSAQYTEGTEVTTGDEIRLRVTRQSGTTAYLPFTATAIATASGFSFKASQQLDLVYNSNGIDGSAITTLTADFPNVQVDVDDADGSCDVREIYARYVNIITTEEGIRQWFGGITALNAVNYQVNTAVNDLTIQNVGTNGVNLGVARIFRDDGAIILAQGNAPITQDNGEFVQFIQPQVDSAMNTNTKLDGVSKNTNLIPALL